MRVSYANMHGANMHGLRLVLLLLFFGACSRDETPNLSKDAKTATHEALLEALEAPRHPSDGGGRAFLTEAPEGPILVGSRHRFEIVYEAGPLGISEGGVLFLQPSPFFGWDAPQTDVPEAPGYTEATTNAPDVKLETSPLGGLLAITIRGRALAPGERIELVYGAGPAGARVDPYAESRAPIWLAVDGDGDGVRSLIDEVPSVDVAAGPTAQLVLTLPSTARPGDHVRLTVAALDRAGNAGMALDGGVTLSGPSALALPTVLELSERGVGYVDVVARDAGVYRVSGASGDMIAESNPLVVRDGIPRILWADLHGHSQLSDGTGTPDDYFWYARDVAALDIVALTDHDHWGMRFLDQNEAMWEAIREAGRRFEEPGRFLAIEGYEWTNWLHGHRHVLYFESGGEVLSSMDPAYETPAQLWAALEGRKAITVAHHSAGGPISTNWEFLPDPAIEPVTEIVSVHGSSEAADTPGAIYSAVPGNFVRDVLDRGARFGFIGSGDSHDGHPGLAHLASPSGGLAAIFSEHLTRDGVLEALASRRVYATNGPRIWLRFWVDDNPRFAVAGTAPIERVDVIRSGSVVTSLPGFGRREWGEGLKLDGLLSGEYVYIRVVQEDGGVAWSSPVFID